MATTSKRTQIQESFKDTRAPELDEEQWRDVRLSKNSKGEWVVGQETEWHMPICHFLIWTALVVFFLHMVCIAKAPTAEEWNDPRAFKSEAEMFWKRFIFFFMWVFAIMILDAILDMRSIDERKLEESETGEPRHSKIVRTIYGISPYKAQSLVILIMPALVLIGSGMLWYRVFISDAPSS